MPVNEEWRRARFERWEKLGLDRVKHDLVHTRGIVVVGGTLEVQELAWEWVRMKEAEQAKAQEKRDEVVTLTPGIWGRSVNLKEAGRWIRRRFTKT
jgi:hypothetical protein